MNKNKHLTLDDRFQIEHALHERKSFKAIGLSIGKDCTTISKEIRLRSASQKVGAPYRPFNDCQKRTHCSHAGDVCPVCDRKKKNKCSSCSNCNKACPDYKKEYCSRLAKAPYVCNGCTERNRCTLEKCLYDAVSAHNDYTAKLSESRSGINLSEDELASLDSVVSPLLKNGQSLHHIISNNQDQVNVCEKTLYAYADCGILTAINLDMPRKVRLKPRKKKSVALKVDKACRTGRTYADYLAFREKEPSLPVVEIDSVEGVKGGAVLLTIHFVLQKFQLAFLRSSNNAASVSQIFRSLYDSLGKETYCKLFPVILADNGTEFSDPASLEQMDGEQVSRVFYCDPSSPGQKGSCEVNHEFIRRIIPKGTDISLYSQEQILLMMSHINSYSRPELGDKSPYSMMRFCFGSSVVHKFGISFIQPNEIILRPSLLDD